MRNLTLAFGFCMAWCAVNCAPSDPGSSFDQGTEGDSKANGGAPHAAGGGASSGGLGGAGSGGGPDVGTGGADVGEPGSGGWLAAAGGASPTGGSDGGTGGQDGGTGGRVLTPPETFGPQGEWFPFPQNVRYPHGFSSTKITSDHVQRWYEAWRSKYLRECNGNLLPGSSPTTTGLVEAQGFAMIAAAYMGDKATLDDLYGYYQAKLTAAGCGLMGWKNNCGGFEDQGSATDGDIDVASGLIVAHWQWPDDGYDDKARAIIDNLKELIVDCNGISALHPGCSGGRPWGGCNETDISYYSPAFFRYFAEISGDPAWSKLADDSHTIRDAAAHDGTGLVPDWQSVSGNAGAGSRKGYYSFDAIRTPFKHGLDYLWNGNPEAGSWCKKITDWANGVGVTRLRDEYQLDGSQVGSNHNLAVVGSLAVCAMANTQSMADAFVEESVKLRDDFWYSGYLGNLYLLAMSGNMWNIDNVQGAAAPRD